MSATARPVARHTRHPHPTPRRLRSGSWGLLLTVLLLVLPFDAHGLEDPERFDLASLKGVLAFERGDYEEAERLFSLALSERPHDLQTLDRLGQTQLRLKRYEAAAATFARLLEEEPSSGAGLLGLGIVHYHEEKYPTALLFLERAERALPQHALAPYYQALTLQKLERYEESVRLLARARRLEPTLGPEIDYLLGVAYARQGLVDVAKEHWEGVVAHEPTSNLGASAKQLLESYAGRGRTGRRRWTMSAAVRGEYDTNVVLLPLGVQPPGGPSGISQQRDYRTTLQLGAEYRPIDTGAWAVGIGYGLFQSFHRTLDGFDVQNHSPAVALWRKAGVLDIGLRYSLDFISVGRDPFLLAHSVQPILRIRHSPRWMSELQLRYQYKDFSNVRFAINEYRDGKNWLAGATEYYVFPGGSGHLRFGYTYDTDRTGGGAPIAALPGVPSNADWAYVGHRFTTGLNLLLARGLRLDAALDYYRQDYLHPNSFSFTGTRVRRDDIYLFTGSVVRELRPWLAAVFQYSYIRDHANLSVFDYSRSLYSVGLSARY